MRTVNFLLVAMRRIGLARALAVARGTLGFLRGGSGNARLAGWTADNMTTVTISCDTDTSDSYVNNGIYKDFPNGGEAPTVTVSATVPYNSFFGSLGLGSLTLNLNAESQAAVIGA